MRCFILSIFYINFSTIALDDTAFYPNEGILSQRVNKQFALLRQELKTQATFVLGTPHVKIDHKLPPNCGPLINSDQNGVLSFNELVDHLVLDSFQDLFIQETGEITGNPTNIIIPGLTRKIPDEVPEDDVDHDYDDAFPDIIMAIKRFVKPEYTLSVFKSKYIRVDLEGGDKVELRPLIPIFDGDLRTGFHIGNICNNPFKIEGSVNITDRPIMHVVLTQYNITDIEKDKEALKLYLKYNHSVNGLTNVPCEIVDSQETSFLSIDDRKMKATIISARCEEIEKGPKTAKVEIHTNLTSTDHPLCNANLKEFIVQKRNGAWYGAHKRSKRSVVVAAAAGAAIAGTSIFNFFHSRGLTQRVTAIEGSIEEAKLLTRQGAKDLEAMGKGVVIELDSINGAISKLTTSECMLTKVLTSQRTALLAESFATAFINNVQNLAFQISSNLPGNPIQQVATNICFHNNANSNNNEWLTDIRFVCEEYLKNVATDLTYLQVLRVNNTVKIAYTVNIVQPDFIITPASLYKINHIPIPLGNLEEDIYRYRELENVPSHMVQLTRYNQTLAVPETCMSTDKVLFCGQKLLDSIYTLESSCMAAVFGKKPLNACGYKIVKSVNDCIVKLMPDLVLLSSYQKITFSAHKSDAVSIHRQSTMDNFLPAGTSALSQDKLPENGYIICSNSRVYIRANRLKKVPVEYKVTAKELGYGLFTVDPWYTQLANWLDLDQDQLNKTISAVNPKETGLRDLLEELQNRRGIDLPLIPQYTHFVKNTIIPICVSIISLLIIILVIFLVLRWWKNGIVALLQRCCNNESTVPAQRAQYRPGNTTVSF